MKKFQLPSKRTLFVIGLLAIATFMFLLSKYPPPTTPNQAEITICEGENIFSVGDLVRIPDEGISGFSIHDWSRGNVEERGYGQDWSKHVWEITELFCVQGSPAVQAHSFWEFNRAGFYEQDLVPVSVCEGERIVLEAVPENNELTLNEGSCVTTYDLSENQNNDVEIRVVPPPGGALVYVGESYSPSDRSWREAHLGNATTRNSFRLRNPQLVIVFAANVPPSTAESIKNDIEDQMINLVELDQEEWKTDDFEAFASLMNEHCPEKVSKIPVPFSELTYTFNEDEYDRLHWTMAFSVEAGDVLVANYTWDNRDIDGCPMYNTRGTQSLDLLETGENCVPLQWIDTAHENVEWPDGQPTQYRDDALSRYPANTFGNEEGCYTTVYVETCRTLDLANEYVPRHIELTENGVVIESFTVYDISRPGFEPKTFIYDENECLFGTSGYLGYPIR